VLLGDRWHADHLEPVIRVADERVAEKIDNHTPSPPSVATRGMEHHNGKNSGPDHGQVAAPGSPEDHHGRRAA
jgi:hypothetical protein